MRECRERNQVKMHAARALHQSADFADQSHAFDLLADFAEPSADLAFPPLTTNSLKGLTRELESCV